PLDANGKPTIIEDVRSLPIYTVASVSDPSPVDMLSVAYSWTVTKNGSSFASGAGIATGSNTSGGMSSLIIGFNYTPDSAGTYTVSLTISNKDGLATASGTVDVLFPPIPTHIPLTSRF